MIDAEPLLRSEPLRGALSELAELDAAARLHMRDPALWSMMPGVQQAITERLGWLDVTAGHPRWRERLPVFVAGVRADGLGRVLLAGMGGSSLAPEVFARTFAGQVDGAELVVLDSTHPTAVAAAAGDPATTLVVVSSKSGSTEETRAFAAWAAGHVRGPKQLVGLTDAGSALEDQARAEGWRAVWTNPEDIGGRYSALSLVGMLPAALAGVDIDRVWRRSATAAERCGPQVALDANPAALLAAFMSGWARAGRDKLTLLLPEELASLGDWVEQLVAESTGKDGQGIIPVVGEPLGAPEVYGDDRAFVAYRLAGAGPDTRPLSASGHPVLTLDADDRFDVGGAFVVWEMATALAAAVLGVNPFDEPNVAESKANTRDVLAEAAAGAPLDDDADAGDVEGLLGTLRPGDYLSLQAYLPPTPPYAAALATLRRRVRDRHHVATTAGWGPRFLHSTGQLHKGGPDTIVALQIVDLPSGGPPIPGRPYDFATLLRAQALGDLRSLRNHRRRVARHVVAGPDDVVALADLVSS